MPPLPARPCTAPGCNALSRDGSGRCDSHKRKAWQHQGRDTSSTARGYGSAWQRLRLIVLARDNGLCQCPECKASGRIRKASEVDHIVGKARAAQLGWSRQQVDSLDNLRSVHPECHKRITMLDQGRKPGQLFDASGRVVW
jgi:5-methylcytosine-specific restriction protein A